jgi:hypothetical protein
MFGGRRGFNHLIPVAEIDTPKRSFSVTYSYGHAKWAFLKERKREHKNGKTRNKERNLKRKENVNEERRISSLGYCAV